jgi:hypothetical protein
MIAVFERTVGSWVFAITSMRLLSAFALKETLISTGIFSLKAVKHLAIVGLTPLSQAAFARDMLFVIRHKNKVGQVAQLDNISDKFNVLKLS